MDGLRSLLAQSAPFLLKIGGALLVLVIGYIVAKILSSLLRNALKKTGFDNKVANWVTGDSKNSVQVERWFETGIFAMLMLFVLIAFFQILDLDMVSGPLNSLLVPIFDFGPRLLSAGILLVVAWAIARILWELTTRGLEAFKLDDQLNERMGLESDDQITLSKSVADIVYWLVFLIFLPLVLDALNMQGLLAPVQGMLDSLLSFLPNLFGALILFGIGWLIARILQRIITSFLAASGADRFGEKVGLNNVLGEQKLSDMIGLIVYVFILIPVIVAALDALKLSSITQPASDMLNAILQAIPSIFGAALVLAIAYVIGKVVSSLVANLLAGVGFNNLFSWLGLENMDQSSSKTPSELVGVLVMIGFIFFAVIEAANLLGFELLSTLIAEFTVFGGQILLGLIILAIGLYLANMAASAIKESGMKQANMLAMFGRIAILVLSGAMALRQMGLADDIVNLAFGLLLGAVAVGSALAFGLGGRDIAARQLEKWAATMDEEK